MSIKIEGVIEWFERRAKEAPGKGSRAAFLLAVDALREKAEREDPKPLTIEELRSMIGEPIYIVHSHGGNEWNIFTGYNDCSFWSMGESFYLNCRYGKGWTAYRHKPKEETP